MPVLPQIACEVQVSPMTPISETPRSAESVAPPQMTKKHVDALETAAECGDASKCELDHASLEEITAFVKSALPGGTHRLVPLKEIERVDAFIADAGTYYKKDLLMMQERMRRIIAGWLSSPIPDGHKKT